MNVLIIEDEKPAVEKLEKMLLTYDPEIKITGRCSSVEQVINWLENANNQADLLFVDIQLTDGLSFEIFERTEVNIPVIFITAYNEYAIKAFKLNTIDYLLKPLNYDDLYRSMEKIKVLRENLPANKERIQYDELSRMLLQMNKTYKTRFLVKVGDHIRSVQTSNISLFYAEGRTVFLLTNKQNKYIVDFRMEDLENQLDPEMFFRTNRSYIVNINAISDVVIYSNSRLKIELNQPFEKEIIVSREKVNLLKTWFEGSR
ncbi:MAG: LytTR family DNA-binding domain-containing protein [Bacteroidales bacterium]